MAGVANTLRVSITDNDGNNRDAILDAVSTGDLITVSADFSVITGLPVDNVTYWAFPFTVNSAFVSDDEPDDAEEVTLTSRVPAAWPTVAELNQVLNLGPDGTTDWATTLARVLAAAITRVKSDVGEWTDADLPTDSQSQAALRMAFLMWTSPDSPSLGLDPSYRSLLTGQRRRFAIA